MNFINELFSNSSAPETGMPDIKQFLGPIMDAMAADVKRANDPISRIGDVGTAVLGTVGAGAPYAQNLAALDARRSESIKNGAGLFLSMLGMEKQIEQLKSDQEFKKADLAIKVAGLQPNFAKDMAEFDSKLSLRDDLPAETKARMRAEFEANWKKNYGSSLQPPLRTPPTDGRPTKRAENPEANYRPGAVKTEALPDPNSPATWVAMTKGWLSDLGRSELETRLTMDKNYQDSVAAGDTGQAGKLFQLHALDVAQQPEFVEAKAGVRPAQPTQPPLSQGVPEAPPNANPKEWRDAFTKKAVEDELKKRQAKVNQNIAVQELEKSLEATKSEDFRTGMVASGLQYVPSTGAYKLRQSLESIKGMTSLEQLNQMRQASNTGASGLGQVTTYEHKLLQSVLGPLEIGMGKELAPNLLRALRVYKAIVMLPQGIQPGMENDILSGKMDRQLGIDPSKYGLGTKTKDGWRDLGDGWRARPVQ